MLTQTCDRYVSTAGANGLSGYGETATTSGIKCRVDAATKEIRRDNDTIIGISALIFVPASATVAEQDKIVVDGQSYIVEEIQPIRMLTKLSHYELLCRGI